MTITDPIAADAISTAPRLAIAPTYKDPVTGALYVHQDLRAVQEPWAEEAHIRPVKAAERFGDVESWVGYVRDFSESDRPPLLTWDASGLRAVLDYHRAAADPGRAQWTAVHPFVPSVQWKAWMALANGQAVGQRAAIERLEDLAEDIREPDSTNLTNLLRTLRASANAKADTELRPDGTSHVVFTKDTSVRSGAAGEVTLPPDFTIAIPVLKGHVDAAGKPVLYGLKVRLRVSVGEDAKLAFRFSIPNAERVLEDVYADRVAAAKELLGEDFVMWRAAD